MPNQVGKRMPYDINSFRIFCCQQAQIDIILDRHCHIKGFTIHHASNSCLG